MNLQDLKHNQLLLCKTLVGSRAYRLNFDNSDEDFSGVFAHSWEDLVDDHLPKTIVENGDTYFELNKFAQLLLHGEFKAFEILFAKVESFRYLSGPFHTHFYKNGRSFISAKTIQHWINTSSFLFGRAKRVGNLKVNEKTVFDFLTFFYHSYLDPSIRTFAETLAHQNLEPKSEIPLPLKVEKFGLKDLGNDFYFLYENHSGIYDKYIKGLVDVRGELITNGIIDHNDTTHYRGVIHYERAKHKTYKRLKELADNEPMPRNYAPKTMYHAFRILLFVRRFLEYQVISLAEPSKALIMKIRRSELTFPEVQQAYNEILEQTLKIFQNYDGPEELDANLVKKATTECRNAILKTKSKYHEHLTM